MISSVTSVTHTQPVVQSTPVSKKSAQPKPQPAPTDSVQLSSAALAALKEATENPVQTAREARAGDRQAQRLLAKEAAEKAVVEISH